MSVTTNSPKLAHYRRIDRRVAASPSAITSAPSASPTATANCRRWRSARRHQRALSVRYPQAGRRPLARALRAGPQPLHPVHALRARLRRGGGRARVGRHGRAASTPRVICEMNQPWGERRAAPAAASACRLPHRRDGGKGLRRGRDGEAGPHVVAPAAGRTGGSHMSKVRLATVWLDGCSGCHMSLLDMDEAHPGRGQAGRPGLRPAGGRQEFPEGVDVTLVEGAVSSQEDLEKAARPSARARKLLVALGDCAVTGNVPAMRNSVPRAEACCSASTSRARRRRRAFPARAFRRCCAQARPCTSSSRWICTCPAARRIPEAILDGAWRTDRGTRARARSKVKFG